MDKKMYTPPFPTPTTTGKMGVYVRGVVPWTSSTNTLLLNFSVQIRSVFMVHQVKSKTKASHSHLVNKSLSVCFGVLQDTQLQLVRLPCYRLRQPYMKDLLVLFTNLPRLFFYMASEIHLNTQFGNCSVVAILCIPPRDSFFVGLFVTRPRTIPPISAWQTTCSGGCF